MCVCVYIYIHLHMCVYIYKYLFLRNRIKNLNFSFLVSIKIIKHIFYTLYTKSDKPPITRPKHVAVLNTKKVLCWMVDNRNLSIEYINGTMFTEFHNMILFLLLSLFFLFHLFLQTFFILKSLSLFCINIHMSVTDFTGTFMSYTHKITSHKTSSICLLYFHY